MVAKLKPIEEEQKMTSWELANNLEKIAAFIKELPMPVIKSVEYSEGEAWGRIDSMIKGVNNRLVELQVNINESEESVDTVLNEHYTKTRDKINDLNKRLSELPKLIEDTRVPYNIKELVETAERMSNLSDDQWKRVIQLVEVFAHK